MSPNNFGEELFRYLIINLSQINDCYHSCQRPDAYPTVLEGWEED